MDNTTKNSFNRDALSIEVYSKLEERLKALHEIVLGGANMQYRLEDIAEHLQELQGDSQYGYDQLKVLWFIASIYDEILHKKKKVNDISSLLKSGSSIEPRIISYKKKGGSQVAITRKVFGFPNEKTTRKNIS